MAQLDENLAAVDVALAPAHLAALDEASTPSLDFPAEFVRRAGAFSHGGTTIGGRSWPVLPNAPANEAERR